MHEFETLMGVEFLWDLTQWSNKFRDGASGTIHYNTIQYYFAGQAVRTQLDNEE